MPGNVEVAGSSHVVRERGPNGAKGGGRNQQDRWHEREDVAGNRPHGPGTTWMSNLRGDRQMGCMGEETHTNTYGIQVETFRLTSKK